MGPDNPQDSFGPSFRPNHRFSTHFGPNFMFLARTGTLISQDLGLAWLWTSPIAAGKSYLRLQHLSCLNSRHLSCLSSRHLSCLTRRHLFQGGPGGSSLQPVDQIAIFGIHPGTQPGETGADRRRPGQTGAVPGYGVKHPQTDPPHPCAKARMTAVRQTPSN